MTITADEFFGKDLKVYDTKMTEPTMKNDPKRSTGRTTGRILQALGNAVENPGKEVEFFEHYYPKNHAQLQLCKELIENAAKKLNLDVTVDLRLKKNCVDFGLYVKSNWVSPYAQRTPAEAYEKVFGHPPECAQRGVWFGFQQGFEAAQK